MFYDEKEISEHLKCPNCKKMFVDPRILDCGDFLWNSCILLLLDKRKNRLQLHFVPRIPWDAKKWLQKSPRLAKLVEVRPNEVSRSPETMQLKSELSKINEKNQIMQTDLKLGKEKIREHCDFVRNDVELITESCHQYVDKYRDEFVKNW